MTVAVVGCGLMGAATARALAASGVPPLLVDRDAARVSALAARLPVTAGAVIGDAGLPGAAREAVAAAGVVATALSWADAAAVHALAVDRGLTVVGIGRPPDDPRAAVGPCGEAVVVTGAGLEPGLTELLARRLAAGLDPGGRVRLWCGGVPRSPRPPLRHVSWYGSALTISGRPTYEVRGGELRRVDRFTGVERVDVPGVGVLEAWHDGLAPWTRDDPVLGRVADHVQKTLRWPGYAARVLTLAELGLLGEDPVATPAGPVAPRAVLDVLLAPHIAPRPDDVDVTVLAVEAVGTAGGHPVHRSTAVLAETADGATGMGRLTGGVLAAAVRALLAGRPVPGVHHAYELLDPDAVLADLRTAGVSVADVEGPWLVQQPLQGRDE